MEQIQQKRLGLSNEIHELPIIYILPEVGIIDLCLCLDLRCSCRAVSICSIGYVFRMRTYTVPFLSYSKAREVKAVCLDMKLRTRKLLPTDNSDRKSQNSPKTLVILALRDVNASHVVCHQEDLDRGIRVLPQTLGANEEERW